MVVLPSLPAAELGGAGAAGGGLPVRGVCVVCACVIVCYLLCVHKGVVCRGWLDPKTQTP